MPHWLAAYTIAPSTADCGAPGHASTPLSSRLATKFASDFTCNPVSVVAGAFGAGCLMWATIQSAGLVDAARVRSGPAAALPNTWQVPHSAFLKYPIAAS